MAPDDQLPFGLYEQLLTERLAAQLGALDQTTTEVITEPVDKAELHLRLGRHVRDLVARVVSGLRGDERNEVAPRLTNELVQLLSARAPDATETGDSLVSPVRELRQIAPIGDLTRQRLTDARPISLSDSDLLVNGRGEPGLASVLRAEVPSADSVDLLCAFVRWHGIRLLEDVLLGHLQAGRSLRVITTVYTGSTERKALDWLVARGAQVKVSYDTQSTRLHAKAWMFKRATGFSTAYIGSSNLSKSAMVDGVEWNVRLTEATSPDVLDKFSATFDTYWASPEYEPYETSRDAERFDAAVSAPAGSTADAPLVLVDINPYKHQEEILDTLETERSRHHRFRSLVVAATGTGKTVVAALDFKRLQSQYQNPTLLFVAHRQEILSQSLGMFRQVQRDGAFGEMYVGGHRPSVWRHVFASIQSLDQLELDQLSPTHFDVVVVDEFHRAAAPTYRRLLEHVQPKVLLGLTATPERTDSGDILHYFGGRIAAELRLWDALERGLLSPFHYFGLHDNTDLSSVRWSRGAYDVDALQRIYTADDARVALVLQQLRAKHRAPERMRALGFCVSIEHARFMADRFTRAGLPSHALWGELSAETRKTTISALREGSIRAIFTVDLFNEGIDIPEVDTVLMLRPTESALVFLQQLGRGLRRHPEKDCLTVLDFIGTPRREFRFDLRYRALTNESRSGVALQLQEGFPLLPAGSSMQLDRVATSIVLDNLRRSISTRWPSVVRELTALLQTERFSGRPPTLAEFLDETGIELQDVYANNKGWTALRRAAGVPLPTEQDGDARIQGAFGRLLHIDDPLRLDAYRRAATGQYTDSLTDRRLVAALGATIWGRDAEAPGTERGIVEAVFARPALAGELAELCELLEDRAPHLTYTLDGEAGWSHAVPLSVHARHSVIEILAAFGRVAAGRFYQHREGVYRDDVTNSDLFFTTLEKSEKHYSPTTMYKDYAIAPDLFHWESQSTTTQGSPTGQRYIQHRQRGGHILLFVRQRARQDGATVPYTFLGLCDHESHVKERPIQFVWRLRRRMPVDFFRDARVAAG